MYKKELPHAVRVGQVKRILKSGLTVPLKDIAKEWGFTIRQISSMQPGASKEYAKEIPPSAYTYTAEEYESTPIIFYPSGKAPIDRDNPAAVREFIIVTIHQAITKVCSEFDIKDVFDDNQDHLITALYDSVYASELSLAKLISENRKG
jgi:hypothetical protein